LDQVGLITTDPASGRCPIHVCLWASHPRCHPMYLFYRFGTFCVVAGLRRCPPVICQTARGSRWWTAASHVRRRWVWCA